MKSFRDLPISRKLTLIIMLVSFLVLLLACGAFVILERPEETGTNRLSQVGMLYLQASLADLSVRQWHYVGIACSVLLAAVVVAFLLARRLQRPITEPVLGLTAVARRVSEQEDYTVR